MGWTIKDVEEGKKNRKSKVDTTRAHTLCTCMRMEGTHDSAQLIASNLKAGRGNKKT